jgi:hypothetical protein
MTIKYDILNRWTGKVQFTAEIGCNESAVPSVKIGLSVIWGVKNGANLRGANLCGADLRDADLCDANLCGANLRGANLCGAKNADLVVARTTILPEGNLIGWKKCESGVIVKLLIPSDAKRSSASGRKCRAERAKVLEIVGSDIAFSTGDARQILKYVVGETVCCVEPFCEDRWQECASGIHFYITRIEAENH